MRVSRLELSEVSIGSFLHNGLLWCTIKWFVNGKLTMVWIIMFVGIVVYCVPVSRHVFPNAYAVLFVFLQLEEDMYCVVLQKKLFWCWWYTQSLVLCTPPIILVQTTIYVLHAPVFQFCFWLETNLWCRKLLRGHKPYLWTIMEVSVERSLQNSKCMILPRDRKAPHHPTVVLAYWRTVANIGEDLCIVSWCMTQPKVLKVTW
jgi:hypothetical protein